MMNGYLSALQRYRSMCLNTYALEICGDYNTCFTPYTVNHVLSGRSKIDKKVLKTNGSLMKVESIAECSQRVFCNTLTCIKR